MTPQELHRLREHEKQIKGKRCLPVFRTYSGAGNLLLALRVEPLRVSSKAEYQGQGVGVRVSSAEVLHAKAVAEKAGLRLTALEKRPDGTVKLEFGEFEDSNDWRASSPLYQAQ